jgi:RNA polymerase sigma-70 factor (ECF subfamily)
MSTAVAELQVRQARDGDSLAFEQLIAPLLDPAYRLATSILGESGAAEDAVQEAAVKAWSRMRQLREPDRLKSWFMGIVVNECRMARRQRWWNVVRLPDLHSSSTAPDDRAVATVDLQRALAGLTAEDRAVLFLYYWMDLPLEDVAHATGVSVGTVKSRIYRAARRLRPGVALEEALAR